MSEGRSVHPYVIRAASVSDIDACVALALLAAPEREATDWRESLLRDIENSEHQLVVAETGGEIIGYGRARLFEPEPDAPADTAPRGYYLTGVFVRPERRREGVGTALTQSRLDWIGQKAADAWFFANARNATSIELHQRFGFEEITHSFSFPGLTFDGGDGILFRLRLRQQT
jgi:ribosomal protein S18 acetylase RimI-like enzyme